MRSFIRKTISQADDLVQRTHCLCSSVSDSVAHHETDLSIIPNRNVDDLMTWETSDALATPWKENVNKRGRSEYEDADGRHTSPEDSLWKRRRCAISLTKVSC